MDRTDIEALAYHMAVAYNKTTTQGAAVEMVFDKNKDADVNILWAMWLAIDAHCDIA